jgi:peptide-methionine (S)-S-oxide reductase
MKMFFGNIFGGGSYNLKIDYSTLDHPCPELGAAAQEGKVLVKSKKNPKLALATFAGGCFWGLELAYQRVPGVVHTAAGYAQGPEEFPNYEQVCAGNTGHTEAIMVYYNPEECKYEDLLDTFFERVDPTTANGQGADRGKQYRTGVYFHSPEQEEVARIRFETEQGNYRRPIASELKAAAPFWPAEDYHQQYLEK